MAEQVITCTRCPMGCTLRVKAEQGTILVEGNGCPRGEEYGRSEFTCPVRTLTSTVRVLGAGEPLLPVRTDRPIPRQRIGACMDVIRATTVHAPVALHQVLVHNIADTGADLIACCERKSR